MSQAGINKHQLETSDHDENTLDIEPEHEHEYEHEHEPELQPELQPELEPKREAYRRKTYVLVLGPSGSGKSSLLNEVCDVKVRTASAGEGLCTRAFRFEGFTLGDQELRLIDSPGFNNTTFTDQQIFKNFVQYLLDLRRRARHSITGVLYLHPVGDDLGSDQLKRNIHALNFLLGESWLPRLTIAVVAKADEGPVDETMLSAFKEPTSPFYPAHVACAEIRALSLEPQNIRDILLRYTQLPPQMPDVQTNFRIGQTQRLLSYINTGMKGPSPKTIDPRTPHQQTTDSRRSSHKTTLGESKDAVQKLELALIESQAEVASLRNQLEQTRSEYASLRSELQLQDNTEQNKIVQSLNDLNRDIENFGRAVAERLVDRYLESAENASTTLQASNISELKRQLGHREGEASLVMSSTGAGMLAEDFIDLALRFTLCRLLYENIFRPFHPALARSPENKFVAGLYEKIQIQEHQTLSAKWRANAFLAIERGDPNLRIGLINKYFEAAIADIHLLLAAFFGEQTEIKLAEQDYNCLRDVISSAWDWNLVLRGTVIVLGDLQPTIYPTCSPFDPTTMAEFEPRKSKKVPPGIAMCTIALGLTASRLRVIGGVPRDEVVCKASVVTEHRYD